MKKQIVWSVLRNDMPWQWRSTKKEAEALAAEYRKHDSKPAWTVREQRVRKKP